MYQYHNLFQPDSYDNVYYNSMYMHLVMAIHYSMLLLHHMNLLSHFLVFNLHHMVLVLNYLHMHYSLCGSHYHMYIHILIHHMSMIHLMVSMHFHSMSAQMFHGLLLLLRLLLYFMHMTLYSLNY